eukprot:7384582-Pyramimonas_sp.AAC.1
MTGRIRRARSKTLRVQMGALRIHFVGVQEAGAPAGSRVADDFLILSSGCNQQGLGVELWINAGSPCAER